MALNRFSFLMFLIPIVIGIKTTVSKVESAVKSDNDKLANTTLTQVVNNSAVGDISIMTEGGSIATKQTIATGAKSTTLLTKTQSGQEIKGPTLIKTKSNQEIKGPTLIKTQSNQEIKGPTLIKTQSDQEIKSPTLNNTHSDPVLDNKYSTVIKTQTDPLLDIPTKNTGKSVVGRKGVNFKEEDSAEDSKSVNAADHPAKASEANTKIVLKDKAATNTAHVQPKKTESTTPIPHKPTVLAYSALENSGDKTLSLIEEGLKHKQAANPGSHPGMIMPIVITVLVVPMFAVLGYMALKRGQEAWKNRHYKRMDFLLDGMYND